MLLIDQLRQSARESGMSGFGVCAADPFVDTRADLEERVRNGTAGLLRFTFADPERATDVRRSFPWARRLVVLAWPYLPAAGSPGPETAGTGRIARFATEDHYRGLRSGLAAVADLLIAAGHRAACLADDNRLVDRGAAVRAGVGWWGKNTMALAPGTGPWVLLGSVVTDADLEPTEPMRRDCGTCDACLPACPTGALIAPGILDAGRCLAHWLQVPGPIPRHLRRAVGDRVYGCDDCLDACPPRLRLLEQASRLAGRVDLIELLAADDRTLMRRFDHFYVPRRRARFLRRNALVALGNTPGPDAVGVLAGYAGHRDPLLRSHAVWALGEVGGAAAVAALSGVLARERDPQVREEAEAALSATGTLPAC